MVIFSTDTGGDTKPSWEQGHYSLECKYLECHVFKKMGDAIVSLILKPAACINPQPNLK